MATNRRQYLNWNFQGTRNCVDRPTTKLHKWFFNSIYGGQKGTGSRSWCFAAGLWPRAAPTFAPALSNLKMEAVGFPWRLALIYRTASYSLPYPRRPNCWCSRKSRQHAWLVNHDRLSTASCRRTEANNGIWGLGTSLDKCRWRKESYHLPSALTGSHGKRTITP